jgi:FMN phosphatase YigB (HAD superfamily)
MLAEQKPVVVKAKEAPIKRQHEILAIKMLVLDTTVLEDSQYASWNKSISELAGMGLKVSCTSSLPYKEAMSIVSKAGIAEFVDFLITSCQTKQKKPSPEIFYKACLNAGLSPKEVLIFDKSVDGSLAAKRSGCHLYKPKQFLADDILYEIKKIDEVQGANPLITSWQQTVQVIVPIFDPKDAFIQAGYGYPGTKD